MDRRDYLGYWAGVREKVHAFDALDDRGLIFGARTRGYGHDDAILPVVPESELVAFEHRTGLTLPLEYRTFLEAYGAGGAGPNYGIRDFRQDGFEDRLSTPFPGTDTIWYPEDGVEEDPTEFPPEDDPVWQFPGLAYICNHGCGAESLIELNGADPGRMWCSWNEGLLKGTRFHEFYDRWLETTEAMLEQYRCLLSIANREPPLDSQKAVTLDDLVAILGSDYRTFEDERPEGLTKIYFGRSSVGCVLIDRDNELVRIEVRGDAPSKAE